MEEYKNKIFKAYMDNKIDVKEYSRLILNLCIINNLK